MRERTIVVSGFSKYFAMTGWRLGYVCAPKEIIDVIYKIHQYAIMCASTSAQYVALEALNASFKDDFKEVGAMRDTYDERRKYLVRRLNEMGLDCFTPRGAFYVFPSIEKTGLTSDEFCTRLLEKKQVACVPGTAFGASGEGHIRCSYATSLENLNEALKRIREFVNEL